MAAIEKRSGSWRAKVRKSGSSLSKTFTKKSDAVMWAAETERAIQLGSFSAKDCTVGELLDRYSKQITPAKKSAHIERFWIKRLSRSWLANIQISKVRPHHIAKYRDERLEEVSANACLKDLNLLSHALNVAAKEWGYNLPSNPVSKVRKPATGKARTRRLEKGEEKLLLESCRRSTNHWLPPLVCFAIETAMRRGELLSLEWKDVHEAQGWLHLEETKNGSPRDVPLSIKAKGILHDLPRDMTGQVFPIHFEALKGLWSRAVRRAE
ncbi:MAG: hypothetical protein CFH38_00154, partial [Alphaproteobacteria bacterium MarineAlpha10_Bin1]